VAGWPMIQGTVRVLREGQLENHLVERLMIAAGAASGVAFLCIVLWTGQFPIRGGPTYTRKDDPVVYWIGAIVSAIIVVISVPIALSLLFEGSGFGFK
jgi:hypothetical protein